MNYKASPDVKLFFVSDFEGICNTDKQGFAASGLLEIIRKSC